MLLFCVVCVCSGEGWCGGLMGGRGGVEDGAVPLCGHHGPRAALPAGCHLAALSGQHPQLEGVHLHTGTHTQIIRLTVLNDGKRHSGRADMSLIHVYTPEAASYSQFNLCCDKDAKVL